MSGIMLMLVGGKGGDAPENTVAPALSDSTPEYNQTISVSDGTWTSITTPTFAYQWQRSGSNISGATSDSYTVVSADIGETLRCVVTATNPFGSTPANSDTSSTVVGLVPDQVGTPSATAGEQQATVTWTELSFPTETGGVALTGYQVLPSPATGGVRSASGSPFTVTGLIAGTAYTFTVRAQNSVGSGPYSSASNSVTPTAPDIGLIMGGADTGGSYINEIQKISIATTGNAVDWGDLTQVVSEGPGSCGSTTRALNGGGRTIGSNLNNIDYGTFQTSGNFSDFGDLTEARMHLGAGNNGTRAVWLGGQPQYSTSRMDYVTIASTGNATTFGSLQDHGYGLGRRYSNCLSNPTYIFYVAGNSGWDGHVFTDFQRITTATTGNSTGYGSAGGQSNYNCGEGNSTTGLYTLTGAGPNQNNATNTVYYITYATSGYNGDFGDLTIATTTSAATGNTTRTVFSGGRYTSSSPYYTDVMGYFTIASSGNATDFGDLNSACGFSGAGASSNGGGVQ